MDNPADISGMALNEQIAVLMDKLPVPVQNFLKGPERDAVSLVLARKYHLHADAAGIFERAYIFMLLGVYTPEEFVEELRDGGITEENIKGLTADINDLVFKRLREEERAAEPVAPAPAKPQVPVMQVGSRMEGPGQGTPPQAPVPPIPQQPPSPPAQAPQPVPIPSPVIQPVPVQAPPIYSAAPIPVPPPPAPSYQATTPIYGNAPAAPAPQHVPARTMESDVERLTQNYQAVAAGQPVAQPAYSVPPPMPPPAPVPPPPPVIPATPAYPPPAMASVRLTPVDQPRATSAPLTKEYGNDPYREPIE